jgi:hypothetical protein
VGVSASAVTALAVDQARQIAAPSSMPLLFNHYGTKR